MAGETALTIIGNLTDDPELRFTTGGEAVCNFTIASTPRTYKDGAWVDGDPLFMRCSAWRRLAENIVESMRKGHRVIASGVIKQRSYETREGEKRTVVEMTVNDVGHSLMFVTSQIHRTDGQQKPKPAPSADPWVAPVTDEPPF